MSQKPQVQLFYNPASGSYSDRALARLVAAFRREGAEVMTAACADRPPAVDERATHICIAGGDGTIRHVAAMLVESGCALPVAIYPVGTVNLLAREAGVKPDPGALARNLLHGRAERHHHPASLGGSMFFACASIGPDSMAVAGVSPALKARIGRLAYVAAFLRLLWDWPRTRLTLGANGDLVRCEAVYVAKGRHYAGPWSFAPDARVGDQRLHVLALRRARRRDYLRFLCLMLLRRDPAGDRNAITFTCRELSISSERPMPIQADGDIVASSPAEMRVDPRSITFC